MKFFTGLFTLLVLFALGGQAFGAERYAVASGNWGSTTTWSATRGGAPGAAVPTKDDTVWIPSPYKVIIEASSKTCYNLTVENGAAVYGLIVNPTSSQVYIRVYGDYVQNDGIIGYDPAKGADSLSNVCFEAYRSNGTLTFKGNGISKISRIRNGSSYSNVVFAIDQDLTLTYPGSTGSGGMGFYPQSAGNTLWVKAGRTLTCVNYCNIGVNSSTSSNGPSTTFLIDGTLKMGASSTFQLMPQAGATVTLTVNGTLDVAGSLKPSGTAGDTSSVVVNAGGILKLGTSGDGSAQFTSASQLIRGLGSVQLAGGTMVISNPAGLDPVSGHIRTASRTYAQTAGYTFSGSKAAMSTGSEFPAKAAFLTINDTTGTVTLTNDLTVDSLSLALGNVATGSKKLTISPNGGVLRTNGYVIGSLVKSVSTGAAAAAFEVGTANGYSPVSLQFGNVTTGGTLTVSAQESVHPNAVTPAENLKRYWTISSAGTVFDSYSAALTYLPADFNTGVKESDDEANLTVNKYTSSAWSKPALGSTTPGGASDGGTIQATGLTSFGDFAIAKKAAVPANFVENFTGAAGTLLTAAGWTQSGTNSTNPVTIGSPGLTFQNYTGSGIGNAAPLANNGQDLFAAFPSINSGSAYLSFLINPSAVLTGDYFIALSAAASQTNYMTRLHVKSSGAGYVVGISKNNEVSGGAKYGTTVLPLNQTSLIVVRYDFLPADTLNDAVNVYVFPTATPASEPATPEIAAYTNNTKTDAPDLSIVTLRQGSSTAAPTLTIDGLRVSTSWDFYTAAAAPAAASFSTRSINFGSIKTGTTKADSVVVTNTGASSLSVDSVASTNKVFTAAPAKASLAAGAAQKFTVTFAPTAAGTQNGSLIFYHTGTSKIDTVQLTGATETEVVLSTIKEVRADANNDFIPDNLNKTFKITGVITSVDFTASSTSNNNYYMQDATAGILLYAKPRMNKPLNIGDSVMVTGSVLQFRGVTEFAPADTNVAPTGSVVLLKSGAKVPAPIEISVKDLNSEKYEGSLVTVKGLSRKPWSTAWPAVTKNANIIVYAGADSTILFIDQDTDIDGTTEPVWPQDITGIATQYTSSGTVYNDGYEIQPRSTADFKKTSGLNSGLPAGVPADFYVEQNYPNPFNPNTTIRYALPFESNVKITIYNLIGEVVSEVVNDVQQAGYHETVFNANNLSSGIYLYSITAHSTNGSKDFSSVRKMILMK